MDNTWNYRGDLGTDTSSLIGYDVEATDGSIGSIDEVSNDATANRIVVDTGFWIFGKKRLLPAGVISRVDHDSETVSVSLTKDQIKNAPDWDDERSFDDSYRTESEGYYSRYVS
jgi:hypothetical protein